MKIITLNQVGELVSMNQVSLQSLIDSGFLPELKNDGECFYFIEEELKRTLNVESLDEPFLDLTKASTLTGISAYNLKKLVNQGLIDHLTLSNHAKDIILLRESDIRRYFSCKAVMSFNHDYDTFLFLKKLAENHFECIRKFKSDDHIKKEMDLLYMIIVEGKNITDVQEYFGISRATAMSNFEMSKLVFLTEITNHLSSIRKLEKQSELKNKISLMNDVTLRLKIELMNIQQENNRLRKRLHEAEIEYYYDDLDLESPVLSTLLRDIPDLSSRTKNALANIGIHTLGGLTMITEKDIAKHRNMGQRTVMEIHDLLTKHDIWFKNEEKPIGMNYKSETASVSLFVLSGKGK